MELRHLRTFEVVVRTLSVTQAARELHYAQSSVSEQIQALERELGTELFDRSQRRLRLTPQGTALAEYTDRIFTLVEEARWAVSRPSGELAIGALETLCTNRLPALLANYRASFPQTRVKVAEGNRGELYAAVLRGDLDLCVTFGDPPAEPALRCETLAVEPLVLIVPPQHRLAGRGEAMLAELAEEPFLATEQGCGFREMFDSAFGTRSDTLVEPVAEVSSIGTLSACVAAGMGCALLPMLAVSAHVDRGAVAMVRIADTDLHTRMTMTWLDRNSAKPTLAAFQSILRGRLAA